MVDVGMVGVASAASVGSIGWMAGKPSKHLGELQLDF